eukprot:CAMPEP_0170647634 /NCGR_PEP_ID=MMETSP0224-20130122/44288_1 /TAXON_ID=285029 /ORGANISM="Togula jolla, Strain CCCM 725" /LENGTH=61 /DNA_ID=CAMNT_0010979071 /DNA_START=805 /DNA_END=987 /DNA_ORIENTATION=+
MRFLDFLGKAISSRELPYVRSQDTRGAGFARVLCLLLSERFRTHAQLYAETESLTLTPYML